LRIQYAVSHRLTISHHGQFLSNISQLSEITGHGSAA